MSFGVVQYVIAQRLKTWVGTEETKNTQENKMDVASGFGMLAVGIVVSVLVLGILIKVRKYDDEHKED
jgi:hypothetical protein